MLRTFVVRAAYILGIVPKTSAGIMTSVAKSKTNVDPAPIGTRDANVVASRDRDDDEHEEGLSAESIELLTAGMDDVRSGRVRRIDPAPIGERDEGGDYVFPERILLDDASFEAFSANVSSPPPNAALRAFFESFKSKKE
jgi:hypothetical protein